MYKNRRLSDSELVLGAVFVVCVFVGIGLVGSESAQRMAMTQAQVATTGAVPTSGATTPTVSAGSTSGTSPAQTTQNAGAPAPAESYQDCLEQKVAQGSMSGRPEYVSKDNCIYHVSAHALGKVDLKPVFKENTKCQVHMSMPFGSAPCVQSCKATLSATIALCGGGFDGMYYQSAQAFSVTNATLPTEAAVGTAGSTVQAGQNANYAPGAVTREPLAPSAIAKTTGYGWNNLPTQQGTYNWEGVPGGMVSYTPGANGQPGTYDFWSTTQFNEANAGTGVYGSAGSPGRPSIQGTAAGWEPTWEAGATSPPPPSVPSAPPYDGIPEAGAITPEVLVSGTNADVESTNVRGTSDDYALPAGEDVLRPNSWEACLKDPSTCADVGITSPAAPAVASAPQYADGQQQTTAKGLDVSAYTGAPPASTPPPVKTINPWQDYSAFTGETPTEQPAANTPFCSNPVECGAKYQALPGPSLNVDNTCKPNFLGTVAFGTTEWVRKQLGYCK